MRVIQVADIDELSVRAADIVVEQLRAKPDAVLCLPTGSTPEGMYRVLRERYQQGGVSFAQARILSVDEYWPLPERHPQSYLAILGDLILEQVDIDPANVHLVRSWAPDRDAECARYDALVDELGIDLLIDGIGENGHVAFNEPAPSLQLGTHAERVSEDTRRVNGRFFERLEDVPDWALTLGVDQLLRVRHMVMLANGPKKQRPVRRLVEERTMSTEFPASLMHLHPNFTLVADAEALGA